MAEGTTVGAGWRQVGAGWIRDEDGFTLTAWERVDGWVWRCRTTFVAADPRHRMRDGRAPTADEAMLAADAAYAALLPKEAPRTSRGRRPQ